MPMLAAEKRKKEQEEQKALRMREIVECSFGLFAEQGIESITMNEIARQAEIGVASLYRYFTTKEELVIEAAIYAWKMEVDIFNRVFSYGDYESMDGYTQLRSLLEIFSEALVTQNPFFRFIYYFDAYAKKEKLSQSSLKKYEGEISDVKNIVVRSIEKGRRDGSITFGGGKNTGLMDSSDDELYFTIMHSLFSLCQKLSLSGEMLEMDLAVKPDKQISLLIEIILSALK
ncbi:MAG: TetR/AcrR family transcriptional regulator [Treponema sp.]|nr:TetR/AcrR family transcriptional regulator [Treponema sp.]